MRSRRRVLLRAALGVALVVGVFAFVIPSIASYASVAQQLEEVSAAWAVALAAGAVFDIITSAPPWRVLLPQLSWPEALGFTQASTAASTVLPGGAPLGMAVSFGLLRRLGVSAGPAGFAVAVTGLWSQVTILLYPLVGVALVLGSGRLSGSATGIAAASGAAAALLVVLAIAVLRSPDTALRVGDAAGRAGAWLAGLLRRPAPSWSGQALVRLRADRLRLLRRRWPALTAATLVNQLSGYLLLELSLRAVGVSFGELRPSETFLAWSIGRLLGSLPLTPAGLGVVELGMIGTLVGFGGSHTHVVAAVLLYRALIILPTLAAGAGALLAFRLRPPEPAAD